MKFKPSSEQLEKIFNPAYEDIMAICDEMDFETKCGNEFIIKFLEDIVEDYKLLVKQLREEEENEIKSWLIFNMSNLFLLVF